MIQKYDYLPTSASIAAFLIEGKTLSIEISNIGRLIVTCPDTKKMCVIEWPVIIEQAIREGILIEDPQDLDDLMKELKEKKEKKEKEKKEKKEKERRKLNGKLESSF